MLSNDGITKAPITAKTARMTRMIGRRMDFIRSRRACCISAVDDTVSTNEERGGVEQGEFGSVTYRGVSVPRGMSRVGCRLR